MAFYFRQNLKNGPNVGLVVIFLLPAIVHTFKFAPLGNLQQNNMLFHSFELSDSNLIDTHTCGQP